MIPHFDIPFRYVGIAPAVNDQDSVNDIAACVYAVCVTNPGDRDEMPDFGVTDPAFQQQPIATSVMAAQISEWEPRVHTLIDIEPTAYDIAVVNANIGVEVQS